MANTGGSGFFLAALGCACCLWAGGLGVVEAGLVFESKRIEQAAGVEDEVLSGRFVFRNEGSRPVRIVGIESTCACLKAATDKTVYGPGEEGFLEADFALGSITGAVEKVLLLHTDEGGDAHHLVYAMEVPEILLVEPKLLSWEQGGDASAKAYRIRVVGDSPLPLVGVQSTRANFGHEVEEIEAGREYRITVTPASTEEVVVGALLLRFEANVPKLQRLMAFYRVVRPGQSDVEEE